MPYSDLRKGRYSEPGREYLITTVLAGRRPLFLDLWTVRLLVRALRQTSAQGDGVWLAWVAMPDHFHGLLSLAQGASLARTVSQMKGRAARWINGHLGATGPVWQPAYHDHALRREEDRLAVARYIVANPLRKGLVERLGDYPHWDSVWL